MEKKKNNGIQKLISTLIGFGKCVILTKITRERRKYDAECRVMEECQDDIP